MEEYRGLLAECVREEKLSGRRVRGLEGLKYDIPKLFRYLEERGLDLQGLRPKEAQEYVGWLRSGKKKDGTPYSVRSICNATNMAIIFYGFLKKKGIVHTNPFLAIRRMREEQKLPRVILKEKELDKLLEELSAFNSYEYNRARKWKYLLHVLSELLYASGLRISEAAALNPEDLDLKRGVVEVKGGKGGKSRLAYLNEYTQEILRIYLTEIRDLIFKGSNLKPTLFGVWGDALGETLNRELKRATSKLGLPELSAHGFRHAVGFHFLRAGCDIRYIKEILGHRRLSSTEVYTRVEKGDLKAVLDRYHPRQWGRKNLDEEVKDRGRTSRF